MKLRLNCGVLWSSEWWVPIAFGAGGGSIAWYVAGREYIGARLSDRFVSGCFSAKYKKKLCVFHRCGVSSFGRCQHSRADSESGRTAAPHFKHGKLPLVHHIRRPDAIPVPLTRVSAPICCYPRLALKERGCDRAAAERNHLVCLQPAIWPLPFLWMIGWDWMGFDGIG